MIVPILGTQYIYVILRCLSASHGAEDGIEIKVYDCLNRTNLSHEGAIKFVCTSPDNFHIGPADAYYPYLVRRPPGISLYELRNRFTTKILLEKTLELALIYILLAQICKKRILCLELMITLF